MLAMMTIETFKVFLKNMNLFWSMHKLQEKGKEIIEKINHLISSKENIKYLKKMKFFWVS